MHTLRLIIFLVVGFFAITANAALDIEITGGGAQQTPIAVVPFGNNKIETIRKYQ